MTNHIFTMGALGDSITTGFNAVVAADNWAHSWATGDAASSPVVSHRTRLAKALPGYQVTARNVAFNGARAADLPAQVQRLLHGGAPDYVSLLIGANDLVRWLAVGEYTDVLALFAQNVDKAVTALIAANPRVMILIAAIPDQARLLDRSLHEASPDLARLVDTLGTTVLEPLRQAYRQRHERANQALAAMATKYPANVRFAGHLAYVRFDHRHLSRLDSYHPSVEGQALLAASSWEAGFWP